jgi:hypothetical protein
LNINFRKEFRLILPWLFALIKWCSGGQADVTKPEDNYEDCEENVYEQSELLRFNPSGGVNGATALQHKGGSFKVRSNMSAQQQQQQQNQSRLGKKPLAHSIKVNSHSSSAAAASKKASKRPSPSADQASQVPVVVEAKTTVPNQDVKQKQLHETSNNSN